MALISSRQRARPPESTAPQRVRPRPLPEILLVLGLFLAYKLGRAVADGHVARAIGNARHVWHLERWLHLPDEVLVQHVLMSSTGLIHAANIYYAVVHFPASIAFLLWLYVARPAHYVWIRRLMAAATGLALVVHMVFPLAPPRMLAGDGMIDTGAVFGPSVYGPPSTDTLSNQYAAMPSLHVGWALIVAIGMLYATTSRWRWLWLAYPATTFTVVLGTANHYWLDGVVATGMVLALLPLVRRWTPVPPAAPAKPAGAAGTPPAGSRPDGQEPTQAGSGAHPPAVQVAVTVPRPRTPMTAPRPPQPVGSPPSGTPADHG